MNILKGGKQTIVEKVLDGTYKSSGADWESPKTSVDILNDIQRACNSVLGRPHFEHLATVPKKENK